MSLNTAKTRLISIVAIVCFIIGVLAFRNAISAVRTIIELEMASLGTPQTDIIIYLGRQVRLHDDMMNASVWARILPTTISLILLVLLLNYQKGTNDTDSV